MPQIECPDSETLSKWLDGQLSPDEAEFHERHLEECESCLGAIDGLDPSDSLAETLSANSIITHDDAASVEVLISKIQQSPASTSWCGSFDLDISGFLEPPEADDELGRLGEHRILELLGTGGMGIVFKAEDMRLQRVVAIKLMHPVLCASRHASRRFMREARATAALEHEHIVTIYNVGEDRGLPWLSIHLLEGESLHDRLMNVEKLPIADAVRIGREIAVGLEVAHARGLLHRDIKPDNIWLRESDDHITILDFGLARIADEDSLVTRQGSILGTPDYMAPEQARGQDVDERCDLFSLGCVLYRMITGVSPFSRGNVMATLHAVVEENVPPACEMDETIPQRFSDFIERLMAKLPDDRPDNVTEVVSVLRAFESEKPDVAVEAQRSSGRRTVINGLLGILIGFLAAFVIQWSTDRGTLVVEVQDETLDVTFKNAGLIIKDADSGEEITLRIGPNKLPSGEYEILVRNSSSKLELSLREFALVRGATKRLSVSWKKTAKDIDIPLKVSRADMTKSQPAIATAPNWLTESKTVIPKPGQALTSSALVQQPAPLTGLASWSVEPRQHRGAVHEIAMHPDGHRVATSGSDGMIRIWNSDNGELLEVVPAHDRRIGDLVWSHSGTVLASCELEGEIRLWRVGNGQQPTKMIRRIQRRAWALAFSPDDRILAFNEGETHLWSLEENRVMSRLGITGQMTDHPWSPDGKLFLTRRSSGFTIWDFQTRKALETMSHAIYSAGWSESGDYLAVTNIEIRNDRQTPMIDIWNVKRLERVRTISLETNLKFPKKNYVDMPRRVRASWSPDGRHFVVFRSFGQDEGNGIVSSKGVRLERWSVDADKPASVVQLFSGTEQPWNSSPELSWSADGRRLAISFFDHALIMDTKTSRVQAIGAPTNQIYLHALRNSVLAADVSGFGLWDLKTLSKQRSGWTDGIQSISLSPSANIAASLHQRATKNAFGEEPVSPMELQLSRLKGDRIGVVPLEDYITASINWAPDGKRLAVLHFRRSQESTQPFLTMVDAESAVVLHRLSTRDGNFVPLFSWAPDGQHYAFRSHSDKNVKIANSKTGEVIQEITAQSLGENELPVRGGRPQRRRVGQVDSIQWSPDGKELLLGVATEREKAERQLPSVDRVYQQAKNVWGIETWHWNGRQCEFVESRFLVQDFTASRFRYGMFSIAPDSKGVTFLVKDHLFYFDRATKQTTECVLPPKTHSNAAGCWFSSRCPLGTES